MIDDPRHAEYVAVVIGRLRAAGVDACWQLDRFDRIAVELDDDGPRLVLVVPPPPDGWTPDRTWRERMAAEHAGYEGGWP